MPRPTMTPDAALTLRQPPPGASPTPPLANRAQPDLEFANVAADYLSYIQHSKGLAPRTVDTYRDWFSHYHKWLDAQQVASELQDGFNTPVLQRFRYSLSMRGLRPAPCGPFSGRCDS